MGAHFSRNISSTLIMPSRCRSPFSKYLRSENFYTREDSKLGKDDDNSVVIFTVVLINLARCERDKPILRAWRPRPALLDVQHPPVIQIAHPRFHSRRFQIDFSRLHDPRLADVG